MATSTEYRPTLSANLAKLLKDHGLSQKQIAKNIGCSTSALSSWVQGTRYPRPEQIVMLANYFGVSPSVLTEDGEVKSDQLRGLSSDAFYIARSYDELDAHGKQLVRTIVDNELERTRR